MSKEAMKLALEALGQLWLFSDEAAAIANPAITALREALVEQPAKQDIPDLIAGALGVSRGTAYDMMREALQEVQQEPVSFALRHKNGLEFNSNYPMVKTLEEAEDLKRRHFGEVKIAALYTTPPAAPVQPVAWGVHDQIALNKAIANHSIPAAPVQEHAEQLAKLGWQYFECPACGSEGAQAFPKPAAQRQWTDIDIDELSVLAGFDPSHKVELGLVRSVVRTIIRKGNAK